MVLETPKEKNSIVVFAENWQVRAARNRSVRRYDRLLHRRSLFTSSGLHIGLTALAILGLPLINWPTFTAPPPMNIEIIVENAHDKLKSKFKLNTKKHFSNLDTKTSALADVTKSSDFVSSQKNSNPRSPNDRLPATPPTEESEQIRRDQITNILSSTTPLPAPSASVVSSSSKETKLDSHELLAMKTHLQTDKDKKPSFETASGSETNNHAKLLPPPLFL